MSDVQSLWTEGSYEGDSAVAVSKLAQAARFDFDRGSAHGAPKDHLGSILLLWAALIRATRDWGGDDEQGAAFGILDAGRGVIAIGLSVLARLIEATGLIPIPDGPATEVFQSLPVKTWLMLLLPSLALIFMQVMAEELVFRGYLLQQLRARFSSDCSGLVPYFSARCARKSCPSAPIFGFSSNGCQRISCATAFSFSAWASWR